MKKKLLIAAGVVVGVLAVAAGVIAIFCSVFYSREGLNQCGKLYSVNVESPCMVFELETMEYVEDSTLRVHDGWYGSDFITKIEQANEHVTVASLSQYPTSKNDGMMYVMKFSDQGVYFFSHKGRITGLPKNIISYEGWISRDGSNCVITVTRDIEGEVEAFVALSGFETREEAKKYISENHDALKRMVFSQS